ENLGHFRVSPTHTLRVAVADHVVVKHHRAHAGEYSAASLPRGQEAAAVSMHRNNPCVGWLRVEWAVQRAGNVKARPTADVYALRRVAFIGPLVGIHRVERRL